ncbi:MAG: FHA domain-containing protein [Pyrinomonadaceae bacterium]|jgi:pSer/pThr/pTyr-binding forkhead associated (FHA) protein|nr:FHA domain-containing protein [Pyrinomonadaceae bacterium]
MSAKLFLKFKDENGETKQILVDKEKFSIGRTPENSLQISNEKLSRKHAEINRFANIFVLTDCNSSNGTMLNGENIIEPKTLKHKDIINLGGNLQIKVEISSNEKFDDDFAVDFAEDEPEEINENDSDESFSKSENVVKQTVTNQKQESTIPFSFFIIAPIFGLLMLVMIGGIFYALSPKKESEIVKNDDDFIFSKTPNVDNSNKNNNLDEETPTPTPKIEPSKTISNSSVSPTETPTAEPIETPKTNDEDKKIQINSASFLRKIADSDSTSFLTNAQVSEVKKKISALKSSSALSQNLKSIKANSGKIQSIATEKNLKPQFLATAVLAKLGNQTGDVISTANAMAETLNNLKTELAGELADESLLIIAAYEQGVAGDTKAMRTTTEVLSRQSEGVSSRTIRTIWFLRSKGKLSDSQYDFALRFLAIGTITQNPKDFNVNTDAVVLN